MPTSSLTAALRLRLTATGQSQVKEATRNVKALADASARANKAEGRPRGARGQFLPTRAQKFKTALGFDAAKGAFNVAGQIGLAAGAMDQFRARLEGTIRGPIEKFADFELTMAQVKGRTDNITGVGFRRLENAARKAGETTQFTASEAAQGLFELAGAGLSVDQQIGALNPVLRLAQAGQIGLADASGLAVETMAQFGLEVGDIPRIADLLNQAANASTIELGDLGESLKYAGSIATDAGLDLKQTSTYMALLGLAGVKGTMAGTSFRGMLAGMAYQSPRAKKALREVGLSSKDLADGMRNPIDMLKKFGQAFESKNFSEAKRMAVLMRVFGREPAAAISAMLRAGTKEGEGGQTAFAKLADAMEHAEGSTARLADAMEDTTSGKMKKFNSQMESIQLTLGKAMVPALTELVRGLSPVIRDFGEWAKHNPRLIATLARVSIIGAGFLAVLAPMALGVSSLVSVFGLLAPAATAASLPLRLLGTRLVLLRAKFTAAGTAAGMFGAAATGAVGLASAAFAGWEFGKLIDGWIGQLAGLRGGLLSTELALQGGESTGFTNFVADLGDLVGSDTLKDAAAGNRAVNKAYEEIGKSSQRGSGLATKVDVQIHDNRVDAKVETPDGQKTERRTRTGKNIP